MLHSDSCNNRKRSSCRPRTTRREVQYYRTTMLSSPIGFAQHGAAAFDSRMSSASICAVAFGFTTLAKFPNVLPCVFWIVNTVAAFAMPVTTYGIGVVLEYRSTDWNVNPAPAAVTLTSAIVLMPAADRN